MCILSKCCGSDTAISDLLKWFLVPSLQCNPILISQLVLVKPKVGEKGWGTGLMYAHQFLSSFLMFPGMKAHAAWLIYESHNIPQSLLPSATAVITGAVSLEISNLIKVKGCKAAAWWSPQTAATGIISPDCLPSPISIVSACASLLLCPFGLWCPWHADSHLWSAMSALTASPQRSNATHLQPTLLQGSQNSLFQGTTNQNLSLLSKYLMPCSQGVTTWHRVCSSSCLSLRIIALLCCSSHGTLAMPSPSCLHYTLHTGYLEGAWMLFFLHMQTPSNTRNPSTLSWEIICGIKQRKCKTNYIYY